MKNCWDKLLILFSFLFQFQHLDNLFLIIFFQQFIQFLVHSVNCTVHLFLIGNFQEAFILSSLYYTSSLKHPFKDSNVEIFPPFFPYKVWRFHEWFKKKLFWELYWIDFLKASIKELFQILFEIFKKSFLLKLFHEALLWFILR